MGWDMDPFVVVSFSKKVFRTRVIRHSLNPQWEEKLLFHVRKFEASFEVKFAVLDWDKLTGNDQVGEVHLSLAELMANAPQPDLVTGLYQEGVETTEDMKVFVLPLNASGSGWDNKFSPKLTVRCADIPKTSNISSQRVLT
jgi:phosphatidylserine decarboxylase